MEKRRVMIVDDEEHFLKITKINLEKTGKYEVETMSSAADIMSRVKSFNPDIILLDILMPGFDGIETCEMLNNDPMGARIPIIILSALRGDADRLKTFKSGVLDYLVKPVKTEELISKIEKHTQFMR